MLRRDVIECMFACDRQNKYRNFGEHEKLVGLTCVFECDDYCTEVSYAVPIHWLLNHLTKLDKEEWDWQRLQNWLQNEYTSEDSESILRYAITENQVVFYRVEV